MTSDPNAAQATAVEVQTTDTDEAALPPRPTQWDKFPSTRRALAMTLPLDPTLAAAGVVAFINGDKGIERASALEAMRARAIRLSSKEVDDQLTGLAEQLPVLHALFLRFSVEAVAAINADHRAKFLKIALGAQNSYARTQALIAALRAQSEGRLSLTPSVDATE